MLNILQNMSVRYMWKIIVHDTRTFLGAKTLSSRFECCCQLIGSVYQIKIQQIAEIERAFAQPNLPTRECSHAYVLRF